MKAALFSVLAATVAVDAGSSMYTTKTMDLEPVWAVAPNLTIGSDGSDAILYPDGGGAYRHNGVMIPDAPDHRGVCAALSRVWRDHRGSWQDRLMADQLGWVICSGRGWWFERDGGR